MQVGAQDSPPPPPEADDAAAIMLAAIMADSAVRISLVAATPALMPSLNRMELTAGMVRGLTLMRRRAVRVSCTGFSFPVAAMARYTAVGLKASVVCST